jgi:very-short-patch-repair endonuclease
MLIKTLSGQLRKLNLKKYAIIDDGSKSKFQAKIKQQLKNQYPLDIICEEVYIPIERFYLDFFIPTKFLVIEVNGRQHKEHVKFFHRTKIEFRKQRDIDQRKRDWCELNGFRLIEIYDN